MRTSNGKPKILAWECANSSEIGNEKANFGFSFCSGYIFIWEQTNLDLDSDLYDNMNYSFLER